MTPLPIRWPVAVLSSLTIPVVSGLLCLVFLRPLAMGAGIGLVLAVAILLPACGRIRRRTLQVDASGLTVQRDTYRMRAGWDDVVGVQRRRHQGLLVVDELVLADSSLEAVDSRGRPSTIPDDLPGQPATRRVMVSLYDKEWRTGPVGEHLPAHLRGA